jgi:hypothetical protein
MIRLSGLLSRVKNRITGQNTEKTPERPSAVNRLRNWVSSGIENIFGSKKRIGDGESLHDLYRSRYEGLPTPTAQLIKNEISTEVIKNDLDPFDPERQPRTVEISQALKRAIILSTHHIDPFDMRGAYVHSQQTTTPDLSKEASGPAGLSQPPEAQISPEETAFTN